MPATKIRVDLDFPLRPNYTSFARALAAGAAERLTGQRYALPIPGTRFVIWAELVVYYGDLTSVNVWASTAGAAPSPAMTTSFVLVDGDGQDSDAAVVELGTRLFAARICGVDAEALTTGAAATIPARDLNFLTNALLIARLTPAEVAAL